MAKRNHPRRGSMAFSPRKRSARPFGHVKSWPTTDASEVRVQGFAGWKAGMTHILSRDLNPTSPSAGQEVRVPVTVVECPKMRILGVRGYEMTPYGKRAVGEAWSDASQIADAFPELFKRLPKRKEHDAESHFENLGNADLCEVRLIVATQPSTVSGIPTKVPDVMEMGLDGGDFSEQLQFAKEKLGEEYSFTDSFQEGGLTDIVAVTKGYGWQGVIKRFGGKLLSHKNSKKRRQHGNMGAFGDGYVRKSIRQGGQTGYHQRTEYNKRILRVANPEEHSITPSGGFLHYGEVKSDYILVHGSVPGPAKRLIRFRDATRGSGKVLPDYEITYVSTASKQGV
ncbi:MAG: 50S ribosomal protein L3 [Euryarchaeota archaeon]|nr:50S ribosomal protein L3 [Euryarchaeota archaeon]